MMLEPERRRRSIRLKDYDYSQTGAYFITVCTKDRAPFFGVIASGEMQLNDAGRMIVDQWHTLAYRFPVVELDAFVVMPNHIHGIVLIANNVGVGAGLVPAPRATTRVAPTKTNPGSTLAAVVGSYKSLTTLAYTIGVKESAWRRFRQRLWQRNYYEHVIRNEHSLNQIRQYIADNPAQWDSDPENPLANLERRVDP